jgi:hypothetical protein
VYGAFNYLREVLDTFKTRPPIDAESKNDVSLLFSFVFKY